MIKIPVTQTTYTVSKKAEDAKHDDLVLPLLERFEPALKDALTASLNDHFDHQVVAPITNDILEFCSRDGKRVRPLLYLEGRKIFAQHAAGEPLSDSDLAPAIGLELLHAFILVHDDLIDRSDLRRGKPAMHRLVEKRLSALADRDRAGRNISLVIGDIIFALAQKCVLCSGFNNAPAATAKLLDYMVATGVGEISDIIFGIQDIAKVSRQDIEWMYWLKTSRYTIECPLTIAATLSGVDSTYADKIGHIVAPAGMAFQIENDLKDFAAFEVSDNFVPDDLLEGKKTAVVRMAFDMLDETDKSFLQLCLSGLKPNESTVNKVRELIFKSGALVAMHNESDALFTESVKRLEGSGLPSELVNDFYELFLKLRKITKGE